MSDSPIEVKLQSLGFPQAKWIAGRSSLADIFRKRRCGIYVLHFSDDMYYVGQATDVVRRYAQHRHHHFDIQSISFKPVQKRQLDVEERSTVHTLETSGFHLRNIQLVSFPYGDTDFDLIMLPDNQERWLTDLNYQDLSGDRIVDDHLRSLYANKFRELQQMPYADEIIEVTREYVMNSIPAVKRGEIAFWNCSCMSYKKNNLQVCIRINIGGQSTFDAYLLDGKPYYVWYLTRALAEESFDFSLEQVNKEFSLFLTLNENSSDPNIIIAKSPLVKGGQDQVFIEVMGSTTALDLIWDDYMLSAVRLFNLGLARKGPCLWGRNHCLDLADRLIG